MEIVVYKHCPDHPFMIATAASIETFCILCAKPYEYHNETAAAFKSFKRDIATPALEKYGGFENVLKNAMYNAETGELMGSRSREKK